MTIPSPLHDCIEQHELYWSKPESTDTREGASTGYMEDNLLCEFLPWGEEACSVLATTGSVELEYAALRKHVGVFDAVCRGTIAIQGEDRLAFIDRLTTQKLSDLKVGDARLAFVLGRKGRIITDVIVVSEQSRILVDCDVTVVQTLLDHFEKYVVADDVKVENTTQAEHRLWFLGPHANELQGLGNSQFFLPEPFLGINGVAVSVSPEGAVDLWKRLVEQGVRPVGWYALNMIRVEELIPMFRIDYDNANLPHETSSCASRVRFDKGCYLGQEVVARMESLGRPKQQLVSLEISGEELPIAGTQIWDKESDDEGKSIGVVTSSAMSPMKGGDVSVIAMVKSAYASDGTIVLPWVGSKQIKAAVHPLKPKEGVV